ncbi:pentapeptide repeat-containing protein [Companilactobacillus tucceti DSM 20183]|uniref:Pentapeptide repeat-containing protein n=1 Tax=Companilactobacillus tucceti DSM 20183 TaxID=1423811 RepID=A0A0R1JB99_9LACO|nr:pentapeptide repeat-containing protein [Companilactobacillus tucceti]KRK65338.1 pentapeptide repeat-containing protein [Companilactobacillus tucceti DSM 20183]
MVEQIVDKNFTTENLSNRNYNNVRFKNVDFSNADLDGIDLDNCLFVNCNFSHASLKNASLIGADLRGCDMSYSDISGANMFHSMLEDADLTGIVSNDATQYFRLHCPEKGAFLGYKKCFDYRIVKLLIPADAKRTSATANSCRCDKAKVMTIDDMYTDDIYQDAISYVDPNFVYRVGHMVVAKNFNPNRWDDSTGGIHFWMTRKEAEGYM